MLDVGDKFEMFVTNFFTLPFGTNIQKSHQHNAVTNTTVTKWIGIQKSFGGKNYETWIFRDVLKV